MVTPSVSVRVGCPPGRLLVLNADKTFTKEQYCTPEAPGMYCQYFDKGTVLRCPGDIRRGVTSHSRSLMCDPSCVRRMGTRV